MCYAFGKKQDSLRLLFWTFSANSTTSNGVKDSINMAEFAKGVSGFLFPSLVQYNKHHLGSTTIYVLLLIFRIRGNSGRKLPTIMAASSGAVSRLLRTQNEYHKVHYFFSLRK